MTSGQSRKASTTAPHPARTTTGYRTYRDDSVRHVQFIRELQLAGVDLASIGSLLNHADDPPTDATRREGSRAGCSAPGRRPPCTASATPTRVERSRPLGALTHSPSTKVSTVDPGRDAACATVSSARPSTAARWPFRPRDDTRCGSATSTGPGCPPGTPSPWRRREEC